MKNEQEDQKKKLDELIRRKNEINARRKAPETVPESEVYRYEELIRAKSRNSSAKEKLFNTAFCFEIKKEEERVLDIVKDSTSRHDISKLDPVLEKERRMKMEEQRVSYDRLKMIDKRTRYSELVREILSPGTRAKVNPDRIVLPRTISIKDPLPVEKRPAAERPKPVNKIEKTRLKPRSLSKKELSPYNVKMNFRDLFTPKLASINRGNLS